MSRVRNEEPHERDEAPEERTAARAETIELHGCSVELRRYEGPVARELFLLCTPIAPLCDPAATTTSDAAASDVAAVQARAVYCAIVDALRSEGAGFAWVVCETLFVRALDVDLDAIRAARDRVLTTDSGGVHSPATTAIEQPPIAEGARLSVAIQVCVPRGAEARFERVSALPTCGCGDCARAHGLRIESGSEGRLYAGGLCGPGEDAYAQTLGMFEAAEALLSEAGMTFADVVRTWIHLRDIDRDYACLNRGRRAFFSARRIDPPPSSTGIGGAPAQPAHDLSLGFVAVRGAGRGAKGGAGRGATSGATSGGKRGARRAMHTATLNEAPEYGADFARGMRVDEENRVGLYISGTASLDAAGRTVHATDFDAQAERMLVNIAGLLEAEGAGFGDVVSAVTYLRDPAHADRLRTRLAEAGFGGFPHALVEAKVCRPELLCETEALAILPAPDGSRPA